MNTTSTALVQQIASSTGELIDASFPFMFWALGWTIAIFIAILIFKSLMSFIKSRR